MSIKQALKTISKSNGFRNILCWIGALYIRLVYHTGRWDVVNGHIPKEFWDNDKPFILAFWHGRILLMPFCWNRKKAVHMLISQHRDGQLIAKTVGHLGVQTIAGSTSKGGAAALRTMLRTLKRGESIGITPDGPRGPRMQASPGIVNIAKMSGVPIIPCAFGAKSRKHVNSWDHFCLTYPFSKGVFIWGTPITVPKSAKGEELENYQRVVEETITSITNEADRLTGHPFAEAA